MAKVKISVTGNLDGVAVFVNEVQGYFRKGVALYRLKTGMKYELEMPVLAPGGTKWAYKVEAEPGFAIVPKPLNKTAQKRTMPGIGRDIVARKFGVKVSQ